MRSEGKVGKVKKSQLLYLSLSHHLNLSGGSNREMVKVDCFRHRFLSHSTPIECL